MAQNWSVEEGLGWCERVARNMDWDVREFKVQVPVLDICRYICMYNS